jgi:hypothetical protein
MIRPDMRGILPGLAGEGYANLNTFLPWPSCGMADVKDFDFIELHAVKDLVRIIQQHLYADIRIIRSLASLRIFRNEFDPSTD